MTAGLMDPLAEAFRLDGDNDEAVVLIHGFTGVPAHFRPLAGFLNEHGYTVNVPRLPGHGTTPADLRGYTAEDWIEAGRSAAAEVSDHRRVHLAGLSMGGLISLVIAQRALAATVTTINSPLVVWDKKLYLTGVAHRFQPTVEWPEDDPPDLDPEVAPYWITYSGFPTKAAGELVSVMGKAYRAAWRLERPSLVIQSKTDETVDPRSATLLSRALGPACRLVWLEHSIHNALLDRERDVIAAAVLDRIRNSA